LSEGALRQQSVVTIDGPSGAGKSTAARMLAARLGYLYVDTGAMYRAVALAASRAGISADDEAALASLCESFDLRLVPEAGGLKVLLGGEDVNAEIRRPEIGGLASAVSARRSVREAMWRLQRELGQRGRAVFEGRDTGTVVLPGARWKFFLTADLEVRAARRQAELAGRGIRLSREEVQAEILARDAADSGRALAPLRPAEEAVVIDSSRLDAGQVVARMLEVVLREAGRPAGRSGAGN
jgi:cytidylate kinase